MKKCPRCRLVNPGSALRCDCGYDFASQSIKASYLDTSRFDVLEQAGALDKLSAASLRAKLEKGDRYVVFQFCISIIFITFKRRSRPYLIRPQDRRFTAGLPYTLVSLVCGWWGVPWGPIWTISTVVNNCRGGVDVTYEVLSGMVRGSR